MTAPTAPPPVVTGDLPSLQLARRVAGHRLPDRGADAVLAGSLLAEPLGELAWRELMDTARRERMLGLLAAAIDDGALAATEDQASGACRAHLESLAGDLLRERELIGLVELLRGSGIDHRVLKGSAVAHLDYDDPALRSFADVDLLVRSDEWDDAIDVLRAAGWEREFREPRPGFDRRFVKGMVLRRQQGGRVELDLHRTLALGPFGLTVRLADLWGGHEVFSVGGAELRALRAEERLAHACFHAALGDVPPRLVPLRDVAQMSLGVNVDFDRVVELARSWRAEAVLARAFRLAWEILGLDQAADAASRIRSLRPRTSELKALEAYLPPQRSYVGLCLATVKVIRRPSEKIRYVASLALPQRDFVTPRYGGHTDRWRRATRVLRSRRSPAG